MAGAATNPDPDVFAYAAAQVKHCLEATHRLGGANYVLWGGREGYDTLLNTDLRRELEQLGRFLTLVVEHKHKIGFKGTLLIEPKPHEPTKHQYDFDAATVYAFLQKYGLENEFKVNIEANHATLAGHNFEHEIALRDRARHLRLGRHQPRRSAERLGHRPVPERPARVGAGLLEILHAGGFTTGGFNFDAKVRRQSIDAARSLPRSRRRHRHDRARPARRRARSSRTAASQRFVDERYAGWDGRARPRDPRRPPEPRAAR